MSNNTDIPAHSVKTEPKFCRCRVCHEHFYGETIEQARRGCRAHERQVHPGWEGRAC